MRRKRTDAAQLSLLETQSDKALVPFETIRTETVLSKLPVHNLAKNAPIQIQINRTNTKGAASLFWEVSHNSKVGQPGQLAYKVDTLVVNRRIDDERQEARRQGHESGAPPLPRRIRLGSLGEITRDLGLTVGGSGKRAVMKALQQNAATFIKAKLAYKAADGSERWLDAFFNRYNVIFTGERFPDGSTADAVYLILSDTYWEVLNSAPYRPLDYGYLRELPPAPQRFYEVISYRVYAALENGYPVAKISYSEYCTYSAQARYYDYDHVKKQMYKVHKPHLASGYIAKVTYEPTTDDDGKADWIISYVPGAKAEAEYRSFAHKAPRRRAGKDLKAAIASKTKPGKRGTTQSRDGDLSDEARGLVDELTSHGVAAGWAQKHVRSLDAAGVERAQHVVDYWTAISPKQQWDNPAGMLRRLLEIQSTEGLAIPAKYPSRSSTKAAAQAQRTAEDQVNEDALRFLKEQRAIDARIDAALAALSEDEQKELQRAALEACTALPNFARWTSVAQEREVARQGRKIMWARLEGSGS
jgi:hypothetical protein